MRNFLESKVFKTILWGLGILIVALFIFQAGMAVGFHRAEFSYRWGDNYYRTFGGHPGNFMIRVPHDREFPNAHGTIGKIIKVDLPIILISDRENVEKAVAIASTTEIRRFRDAIAPTDLSVGEFAVVIGSPNEKGQINAELIRLLPEPPVGESATGTVLHW